MIKLSIINDELFIETENQILHTKIVNTNWDKIKNVVIREFLKELAEKVPDKHKSGLYAKHVHEWSSVWTFLMNETKQLEEGK